MEDKITITIPRSSAVEFFEMLKNQRCVEQSFEYMNKFEHKENKFIQVIEDVMNQINTNMIEWLDSHSELEN